MRKQIFLAICTRLSESVPEIKFFDLWNNNIAVLNGGAVWPLPAVFVEFDPITWHQQNNGARRGDVFVCLHIVTRAVATHGHTDPKQPDALAFLDLIDRVNAAMQGLRGEQTRRGRKVRMMPGGSSERNIVRRMGSWHK